MEHSVGNRFKDSFWLVEHKIPSEWCFPVTGLLCPEREMVCGISVLLLFSFTQSTPYEVSEVSIVTCLFVAE